MSKRFEELKRLIHELKIAGDDERLDVEQYVEICMEKVLRCSELIDMLDHQEVAHLDTGEVQALHDAATKMQQRAAKESHGE